MIVDDDVRVRTALHELVESAGDLRVVATAASVRRALLDDADHQPDVVLLDVLLPGAVDGMKVLEVLRRRGRPVVAISVDGSLRSRALAAGASAFIEKDGREIDTLHEAIRTARTTPRTSETDDHDPSSAPPRGSRQGDASND
jgi:DNA-binding NarL/FixJ family response regulator